MNITQHFGSRNHPARGALLAKVLWVLAGFVVLGVVAWMIFLPRFVAATIHSRTGFAVQVDKLSVNPFTAKIAVSGLVLKNPADWPSADFVDLREFRANADLFSLFGDRLVADEVVLDLPRLTLVRNKDGVLNAVALKEGLAGKKPTEKKNGAKQQFLIKHLSLKFGTLVYIDHTKSDKGVLRDYEVNLTRDLENVDSVAKILDPFRGTLVMRALTDAIPDLLKKSPDLLQKLTSPIQEAGKATGEALKGLLQSLEKKKS